MHLPAFLVRKRPVGWQGLGNRLGWLGRSRHESGQFASMGPCELSGGLPTAPLVATAEGPSCKETLDPLRHVRQLLGVHDGRSAALCVMD